MATSKLEMSLDDIIKQGKKEEKGGKKSGKFTSLKKSPGRKGGAAAGARMRNTKIQKRAITGGRKRLGGIQKNSSNKNQNTNQRGGRGNTQIRRNQLAQRKMGRVLSTTATSTLVKKLVKKALSQVTAGGRGRRFGGGIRAKLQRGNSLRQRMMLRRGRVLSGAINRVNQRSRAIVRRPRIVMAPVMAQPAVSVPIRRRRQQQRQLIQYIPVVSTQRGPAILPQRNNRRNNNRGGNFIPNNNFVQFRPTRVFTQQQRNPRQQFVVGGSQHQQRQLTIRQQINALRRAGNGNNRPVQFVQHQQRRAFIQQPQRRQSLNQQPQRRVIQRAQSIHLNRPFIDPPNFLQRF